MSRRTIVILIIAAIVAGVIALVVWIAMRGSAEGAVVEAATQLGADPVAFRDGRDPQTARRLAASLSNEIQAMIAAGPPTMGGPRWVAAHQQLAALWRRYPELRA